VHCPPWQPVSRTSVQTDVVGRAAERAALHWVPQSQLPALNDDETLDQLEQAARSGLAARAKQVHFWSRAP
jgi:hypothetical protein